MEKSKLGIEYTIFEYRGQLKKPVLNYRPAPGNVESGIKLIKDKFGEDFEGLRSAIVENRQRIREGTINPTKSIFPKKEKDQQ